MLNMMAFAALSGLCDSGLTKLSKDSGKTEDELMELLQSTFRAQAAVAIDLLKAGGLTATRVTEDNDVTGDVGTALTLMCLMSARNTMHTVVANEEGSDDSSIVNDLLASLDDDEIHPN